MQVEALEGALEEHSMVQDILRNDATAKSDSAALKAAAHYAKVHPSSEYAEGETVLVKNKGKGSRVTRGGHKLDEPR